MLQVDGEKIPHALGFESQDLFFFFLESQQAGSMFHTAIEEDGDDERLVKLKLACEADGVAPPGPVCLAIATTA